MALTKSDILKRSLLLALEKSLGVVTTACRSCDCSRETFYKYVREDEDFAKKVEDIENIAIDFAESQLHKQIGKGNAVSTIFYLKTKGKKRGYIERTESVNENNNTNTVNIVSLGEGKKPEKD